jgi:signal transduction histidine kinase
MLIAISTAPDMNKWQTFFNFNSFVVPYGTAALLTLAALVLTLLIWSLVQSLAAPLFLAAISVSAWKKGFGPGIFATLLSGLTIDYFFTAPEFEFGGTLLEITRLFIFALEGFVLCWLISAKTSAVEEIQNSREQLLALSSHQQTLLEKERKRIALEIHDELGQSLTGLKMELYILNRQIKDVCRPGSDLINDKVRDLLHLIDDTIGTVRRIATELRPPILDDLGLIAALEWHLQEFQRRACVSCKISSNIENVEVRDDISITIFRIFQESLTNIMRHADAKSVTVNLTEKDNKLILRIEDNGKGIAEENITGGKSLGVLGMRERARQIGGDLQIFKGPETGTTVLLTVPIV